MIVVDRHNGGGKLWLNYLVDSVTWKPQYKLRAGKAAEPIQVDYLAAVVQHTGEEWRNVDLTLSTAQPMLSAAPPELKMLEVAVVSRASVPLVPTARARPGHAYLRAAERTPCLGQEGQRPAAFQGTARKLLLQQLR